MDTRKFESLNLSKETLRGIKEMGFEETSPIQARAIPSILQGQDLIGQAQTGTGKTAAFGIPLLEKIDPLLNAAQAIVLCPTRELAIQVAEELSSLGKFHQGLSVLPIYGGQPIERQIKALRRGIQIIIGTPGRVMDHLRRKTMDLSMVNTVVLDEADEMLDMGFRDDMELILSAVPRTRQTIFFSATIPPAISKRSEKYLQEPEIVKISHKVLTVPEIEQIYIEVSAGKRLEVLTRILDYYNPGSSIVFSNTKKGVDNIVRHLQTRGYLSEGLHGDMNQNQRDRVMSSFRSGKTEILVATDVAARGLDVEDIQAVVNFDVPSDVEYYVHRIGRTGRAGRSGKAFTFVTPREMFRLRHIQKYTHSKIQRGRIPTQGDVEQARKDKFFNLIQETVSTGGLEKYLDMVEEFMDSSQEASSLELSAALLKMLMGPALEEQSNLDIASENNPTARSDMVRLKFSTGFQDKIAVKDIVGAIAGETGLPGRLIGKIDLGPQATFVDVPREFSDKVLKVMDRNQIKGKKIRVTLVPSLDQSGRPGKKPERARLRLPRKTRGKKT
ncbi:MAG: DEAD/DEAH box helicase [Desulfonatronovibrionaceae bacterium]